MSRQTFLLMIFLPAWAGLSGCYGRSVNPEVPTVLGLRRARLERPVVVQGNVVPGPQMPDQPLPLRDTARVRRFLYAFRTNYRSFLQDALLRFDQYSSVVQPVLEQYLLPKELINVALVESRFQPAVRSPMGAVGLWQFMAPTARRFGLKVSMFRDERKDPLLSTRAAARYFNALHLQFRDWWLAVAAYNAGPSRIAKLMEEHQCEDFFSLDEKGVLPAETSNFVHKVMAVTLVLRHREEYGFPPAEK